MEFLDEDARPKFLFQSRPQPSASSPEKTSQKPSKTLLFISLSISSILLSLSLFSLQVEPFKSLLFWDLGRGFDGEEKEWSEADVEILKKQMVKNPVGKPGRWEAIAAAFQGKHKTESVIKKAKELGEKKVGDGDSYAKFLKNRKPFDMRINEGNDSVTMENQESKADNDAGAIGWSSGEDIALLNALKAFPKDVPMRWEKIAAAVPGKSKADCMKRVAELKRDYRSSKAGNEGN
ncbi:hypothetical protein DITRI_Ditri07aG0164700 [Diplodiscus trichospermus]